MLSSVFDGLLRKLASGGSVMFPPLAFIIANVTFVIKGILL
jgi:hypothetical protein